MDQAKKTGESLDDVLRERWGSLRELTGGQEPEARVAARGLLDAASLSRRDGVFWALIPRRASQGQPAAFVSPFLSVGFDTVR